MSLPGLDRSCAYYYIGQMTYRWPVPENVDEDAAFRLKLTTDRPPSSHLSGRLQISDLGGVSSSRLAISREPIFGLIDGRSMNLMTAGFLLMLIVSWMISRQCRRAERIRLV